MAIKQLPVSDHSVQEMYQIFTYAGQLSGIALDYGRDDRGFETRQRLEIFLFTTGSGAHPVSYLMGSRGSFLRGKAAGV
jgi:hypothetical protein